MHHLRFFSFCQQRFSVWTISHQMNQSLVTQPTELIFYLHCSPIYILFFSPLFYFQIHSNYLWNVTMMFDYDKNFLLTCERMVESNKLTKNYVCYYPNQNHLHVQTILHMNLNFDYPVIDIHRWKDRLFVQNHILLAVMTHYYRTMNSNPFY